VSEREHIWQDPADPTEKRDWDIPSSVHGEAATADVDRVAGSGGLDGSADEESTHAHEARGSSGRSSTSRGPADVSEKRDWDIP
jgi:hypothetical protein